MNGKEPAKPGQCGRQELPCRLLHSQEGFTYIGVLLAVVLLGIHLSVAGIVWSFAQDRQRERELLFVGDQFRTAISRYYLNPQGPQKEYPKRLEDLVRDPRYTGMVRHLRKIYADPITGKVQWGLIRSADGSILGVYSLSDKPPIKVGNFLPADQLFEKKQRYSDWKFLYTGGIPGGIPSGTPLGGRPVGGAPAPPVNSLPNSSGIPNASAVSSDVQMQGVEGKSGFSLSNTSYPTIYNGEKEDR